MQQFKTAMFVGIEVGDVRNRDAVLVPANPPDGITRSDFSLFQNGEVKSRSAAGEEPLNDIVPTRTSARVCSMANVVR